jgi:hypothetical protein
MKTLLVGINNTLSDARWRSDLPFDESNEQSIHDRPFDNVAALVNALNQTGDWRCIGFTAARPAKWRDLTFRWLLRYGVQLHDLLMRPDDEYGTEAEVKFEISRTRLPPDLVIDDREDVLQRFSEKGCATLLVHNGGI